MAITRSAILFAKDAGRYLIVDADAETFDDLRAATRYTNLAAFESVVPTKYWKANQFGDETKTLNDAAYGYEIKDKFFVDPAITVPDIMNNTPNVAGGRLSANTVNRTSVMYSHDRGAYLWIDPTTRSGPYNQMIFSWVDNAWQASRWSNLTEFQNILDNTELGRVTYGWGIQQFVFTKQELSYTLSGVFNLPGVRQTGTRVRAYVPFAFEVGRYLWINPSSITGNINTVGSPGGADPAVMVFDWVVHPWEGQRFQNLQSFRNIVNARPDFFENKWTVKTWETPQFFFTQSVKQPPKFACEDFFTNNECGQIKWVLNAGFANTWEWFRWLALQDAYSYSEQGLDGWKKYLDYVWYDIILNADNFLDPKCYRKWFDNQDKDELIACLYNLWREENGFRKEIIDQPNGGVEFDFKVPLPHTPDGMIY